MTALNQTPRRLRRASRIVEQIGTGLGSGRSGFFPVPPQSAHRGGDSILRPHRAEDMTGSRPAPKHVEQSVAFSVIVIVGLLSTRSPMALALATLIAEVFFRNAPTPHCPLAANCWSSYRPMMSATDGLRPLPFPPQQTLLRRPLFRQHPHGEAPQSLSTRRPVELLSAPSVHRRKQRL